MDQKNTDEDGTGWGGLIEIAFIRQPQVTLYALGIVTFMVAFYLANPLIGLAGAAILLGTTIYYRPRE